MVLFSWFAPFKAATLFVLLIETTHFRANAELLGSFVPFEFTGSLIDLPIINPQPLVEGAPAIEVNPRRRYDADDGRKTRNLQATNSTKVSVKQPNQRATDPLLNFAGIPYQFLVPPDTVGDIGLSYYIQATNSPPGTAVQVFDKIDGSPVAGPFALSGLANPSGACSAGLGDPIILYDQFADRWLLTELSALDLALCVYVSQTSDPINGGWYGYEFQTPNFPDYPKYGIWNDAYYVGTNEETPAIYALQRSEMLNGGTAKYFRNTVPRLSGFPFQITVPIDADGQSLPPAGSPGIFVRPNDDESHGGNDSTQDFIEIFEYTVDFDSEMDTVTGPIQIGVDEFDSDLCGLVDFACVPQPGTDVKLDPLREPIMNRPQYRNFGTYETIVLTWVTDVDGNDRAGVRWAELRREGGSSWTIFQDSLYSPDATNNRFMSSIAMDGSGNIALGYSISSSQTFPGIRYVGREASDDLDTMTTGTLGG